MNRSLLRVLFCTAILFSAPSALAAKMVPMTIREDDQSFTGDLYLSEKATGPVPMVIVVHEWWGKNEYPKMRARKIADELGFAALAVDLFGEGKTVETPQEAQALAGPFYKDPQLGVRRLRAFIAAAPAAAKNASASIDTTRLAAIGYCFGGSQVLNLARADQLPEGVKLLGVVSFHGNLASSLKAQSPMQTRVLVLHGTDDSFVKPEEVAAFKKEMKKAGAKLKFVSYPGATHAFTNPRATEVGKKHQIPIAYNESADKKSWKEMRSFLKDLFRK